ncbi:prohead protease/major capsid protein fusion protein [Rhizobium tumorigenes]|uniref:prohead protease/major capsid protein fusion protein n=1 Tax=Rhizobium tumorigenes TaxID=2041385 RepID=UPI0024200382|nr:prohead protease/major capsid protein fusion protein [Rhizobium tumorigenes]WFS02780.1 hypothetical protein PR016_09335 [Rhizobium tumorigenes]
MNYLLKKLAKLQARAAAKIAEVGDDTAADAVRAIEAEHGTILEEIAEVEAAIDEAKADEAGAERGAPGRTVDDRATRAERERAKAINALADKHDARSLAAGFIDGGKTVDAFRVALLDHLADKEPKVDSNSRATVGTEHAEKRAAVIEAVITHRVDSSVALPDGAREFRGMSLVELARESLEASGVKTRGMSRQEIAGEALSKREGGMHSTSDFPTILGNVVNRVLRNGYEAAPQTFRPFVTETSVSDFKTVSRAQLGEAPRLEKVNESGEFKRGTLGEGSEKYSIATYGKVIGITRQALINDDLGAFTRIARMFGVSAAQLESDLVWAQLLANPTMGDGVALFHASHKNLQTATAFGTAPLSKMNTAMAKQTGVDGKTVLNITPSFIIVPVELQVSAEQLLSTTFYSQTAGGATPKSISTLQLISEARLDNGFTDPATGTVIAGSSTAFYTATSPGALDTVELAYLDGQRGVYTESKMGFNTDGVEIKARLDVGAKVIDWRSFQKNAGA